MSSINKAFENWPWVIFTVFLMVILSNQICWIIVYLDFIPPLAKYALAVYLSMPTTMNSGLV